MSVKQMVRQSWARFYELNQRPSRAFQSNNIALPGSLTQTDSMHLRRIDSLLREGGHRDSALASLETVSTASLNNDQNFEHDDICEGSEVHCREREKGLMGNLEEEAKNEEKRNLPLLQAMVDLLHKQGVDDGRRLNECKDADAEIHCMEETSLRKEARGFARNLTPGRQATAKGQQGVLLSNEQSFELLTGTALPAQSSELLSGNNLFASSR